MHHAIRKHGTVTRDHVRRAGIVTEEVGEAMEQALKMTSGDAKERGDVDYRGRAELLAAEWKQIAGYAILVLMEMERERGN